MRTLFKAPIPETQVRFNALDMQAFISGVMPGMSPTDTLLWADGENVVFQDNVVSRAPGWRPCGISEGPIRRIAQAYGGVSGAQRIYFATDVELRCWQEGMGVVVLQTGLQSSQNWHLVPYGNWLIASNGKDRLQRWAGSFGAKAGPINTTPFVWAKILKLYGPHLVAMNTDLGRNQIFWCHEDDVETWESTSTNSAGELVIRDLESEIVAAEPLGEDIAMYSKDGMSLLSYLGMPYIFGARKLLDSIGAASPTSVVSVGRQNLGLGLQGFWITDGGLYEYIDTPVRELVRRYLDWERVRQVVAYHDEWQQQVIWFYPQVDVPGENSAGLGFNYKTGAWSRYNFGRTAADPRRVFDYPLTGDSSGVYYQGLGLGAGALPIGGWIQTKPLDMGAPERYKRVQQLRLGLTNYSSDLIVKLGSQRDPDASIDWFYTEFNASSVIDVPDREVLYLVLRIESVRSPWSLGSIHVLGEVGGAA